MSRKGKRTKPPANSPSREEKAARRPNGGKGAAAASTFGPKGWLLAAVLVVAVFLVYQPVWHGGFIWDDDSFLTDNPLIKAHDGLYGFWFTDKPPDYFPLTSSMLWLEWRLWGLNAIGYHLVNILLHGFSAVLLWRVLRRLSVPGAWMAGLLFAVHPVNVESVAWITERKNVLPMVFYLLAFLTYFRFEENGRRRWYIVALGMFLLGLLAKTSVVMLPVLLLGCAWWRRGKMTVRDLWRSVPFFALSLILGLVTVWYQTHRAIGTDVVRIDGFASRLAVAGYAVWFYLYKALLPINLCFVYPRWSLDPALPASWLPLAALAALFTVLIVCRHRAWGRPALFALGYYVVALLPVLGFINIYFMQYSLVADHWQYFAIIGVIAIVTAGCSWIVKSAGIPRIGYVLCAALVATLAGLTWQQSRVYADAETLYRTTITRNPDCWMAHDNLSAVLLDSNVEEAMAHAREALRLNPDHAPARNNLGLAMRKLGRLEEARAQYMEALRINPDYAPAHNNLGYVLQESGHIEEAISQYEEALRISRNYPEAHYNLGNALQMTGRTEEAVAQYRHTLQLAPDFTAAHYNLGLALQRLGRQEEAAAEYREALRVNPNLAEAYNNLGLAMQQLGRIEEALTDYTEAVRLKPGFAVAHNNRANALEKLGRFQEAIAECTEALRILPDYPEAHVNLGVALEELGRLEDAVTHFKEALRLKPDFALARTHLMRLSK
jgi:tetratricopeptide (TPR) repeat protein